MITILDLVRNCSKIGGQVIVSPTKISIDQRIPNNPMHSNNGGDYFEWMIIAFETNSIHFVEKSSCELPISLNNWHESVEGIESFSDLAELVINLATNYDCKISDTRI